MVELGTAPPNEGTSAVVGEWGSVGPDESFVRFFFRKPGIGMRRRVREIKGLDRGSGVARMALVPG